MDLIIQVNPPTFLCCSSHTWASEDDERWVGRKAKERDMGWLRPQRVALPRAQFL